MLPEVGSLLMASLRWDLSVDGISVWQEGLCRGHSAFFRALLVRLEHIPEAAFKALC